MFSLFRITEISEYGILLRVDAPDHRVTSNGRKGNQEGELWAVKADQYSACLGPSVSISCSWRLSTRCTCLQCWPPPAPALLLLQRQGQDISYGLEVPPQAAEAHTILGLTWT
jgi:hypothetical protein